MDFDELVSMIKTIYKNTIHPIVLTDSKLNICWANSNAVKRYPSLTLPNGIMELINNYDYSKILDHLKTGRTFLAKKLSEPFNEISLQIIPILDNNDLLGCQVLFKYDGYGESTFPDEHSNEVVAAFSNEYKMPLTVIFSTLGLMARHLESTGDEISKSYLKLITQNCYRILRMSNNLVEVSRYRSGISKTNMRTGDLCKFFSEMCGAACILTKSIGIPLECVLPDNEIITVFDPEKISLAFFNLLSNSCKYTREGNHIKVKVEEQKGKSVITVSDKGEGIRSDVLSHIFEPYYSHMSESSVQGAGLGLSIVKYVITQHGGTIAVQSHEGDGTTVAFSLPIRTNDDTPDYTAENSAEYLADRFSTLYVEMSDVCGCPLP